MFIQMLEGLHKDEAEILLLQRIRNCIKNLKVCLTMLLKPLFGWDDDYVRLDK